MPQLLTPEQIEKLKKIIQKHHAAVIYQTVGPDALTDSELALLEGMDLEPALDSMLDSYTYGQLLSAIGDKATTMSAKDVENHVRQNPTRLSVPEQRAVEAARQHAGAHLRHLGSKVEQQASMLIFREDAQLRSNLMGEVRDATAENIAKRRGIANLKKELRARTKDFTRDWNRVSVTEKVNAMNQGQADAYAIKHGDPEVYKQPFADACRHCLRLHIGPDGHPRIFRLSTLTGNGTNVGRKSADWQAVVGVTHPHCQCQLIRVPDGWGFDEDGDLVPGGTFGVRYGSEDEAEKAMKLEDQLQKAMKVKERVNIAGIPIAIENPVGDVRAWTDAAGPGATRMLFAYGYIEGTLGPDGDEYDCYVGPDPTSPYVYVVHQRNTDGEYDEDKAMIGFPDLETARLAYEAHYGSTRNFSSIVSVLILADFKDKVMRTGRPGTMQADGMVKARANGSVRAADAAQHSIMGNRGISPNAGGVNFVIGVGSPYSHLQAAQPRVQITPQELASQDGRVKRDRKFVIRRTPEQLVLDAGHQPTTPLVHPYDETGGPAAELGGESIKQIPQNRKHLEAEIEARLEDVTPNGLPPAKRPSFVIHGDTYSVEPIKRDQTRKPGLRVSDIKKSADLFTLCGLKPKSSRTGQFKGLTRTPLRKRPVRDKNEDPTNE